MTTLKAAALAVLMASGFARADDARVQEFVATAKSISMRSSAEDVQGKVASLKEEPPGMFYFKDFCSAGKEFHSKQRGGDEGVALMWTTKNSVGNSVYLRISIFYREGVEQASVWEEQIGAYGKSTMVPMYEKHSWVPCGR